MRSEGERRGRFLGIDPGLEAGIGLLLDNLALGTTIGAGVGVAIGAGLAARDDGGIGVG